MIGRRLFPVAAQFALLFVILQVYSLFRKTYFLPSPGTAFDNAEQIIRLQEAFGLSVHRIELPLQRWVLSHGWLIDFFNVYYQNFKAAFFASAVLCILLAPLAYRRIRSLFLIATMIALPWYALYPLAPPRLMDAHGYSFIDTLAVQGGVQSTASGLGGANQFAAMPSMHIGWTLVAALWLSAALPWWRIGAILGAVHVTMMCLTVMVTGNHYLLDIVGGFLVVALAVVVVRWYPVALSALPRSHMTRLARRVSPRSSPTPHGRARPQPPSDMR